MTQGKVISLGSVNADFQVRVDRIPNQNETLPTRNFIKLIGAKAANVALFEQLINQTHAI